MNWICTVVFYKSSQPEILRLKESIFSISICGLKPAYPTAFIVFLEYLGVTKDTTFSYIRNFCC